MVMIVCPIYIHSVVTLLHRYVFQCGKYERPLNTSALQGRVLGKSHGPGMDMFSVKTVPSTLRVGVGVRIPRDSGGHFNVVPSR